MKMWRDHGTKLLGGAQSAISGFVAISGLIPADQVKYWLAANVLLGVLTVNRGFTNTRNTP